MNEADFELLKAEAFAATARHDVALAAAVMRIERDLALMFEKVSRIEFPFSDNDSFSSGGKQMLSKEGSRCFSFIGK